MAVKTFGQLLDEYMAGEVPESQDISSLYMYMEDYQTPKIVIHTTEGSYDYTEIIYKVVDLRQLLMTEAAEVKSLQAKIRQLEKSKSEVEKAIRLLRGDL